MPSTTEDLLRRVLDHIDYGVMVLGLDGVVLYRNRTAAHALAVDQRLPALVRPAAVKAARGLRSMVRPDPRRPEFVVACTPLQDSALLLFGRPRACEPLSVQLFAQALKLTPAEENVLRELCEGWSPADVARRAGVRISTVRTQINSIRNKVGARSVPDLLTRVTTLPPVVGALALSSFVLDAEPQAA